jgi:hypothetical protein
MPRKQKTIHYLYKTICLVTDRYYIGMHSTDNLEDGYMGSGKRLRYSIRKYGVENHKKEILECFETRELLIEAEKVAITPEMLVDENCMNLMGGGKGGFISDEHYINLKKLASEYQKEKWLNAEFVSDFKEKSIIALKQRHKLGKQPIPNWLGKKHSDETRIKMSIIKKGTNLGKENSQYGTCWITKDGDNKKIKIQDIDTYLKNGWVRGRCLG